MLAGQPWFIGAIAVRPGWPALPRSFFHFFGASGRRGAGGLVLAQAGTSRPPFLLPTRGSATPLATYCCTHYTMTSNSCVCWCVVAVPPESPLKIAASFFRVKARYLLPESLFSHTHCNSSLPTLGENQKMQDIKESLCVSSPRDLSGLDSEKISSREKAISLKLIEQLYYSSSNTSTRKI